MATVIHQAEQPLDTLSEASVLETCWLTADCISKWDWDGHGHDQTTSLAETEWFRSSNIAQLPWRFCSNKFVPITASLPISELPPLPRTLTASELIMFTARRCASMVHAVIVCLSVHLSQVVVLTKMAKRRITQTTPYPGNGSLVFWGQKSRQNCNGITPNTGCQINLR